MSYNNISANDGIGIANLFSEFFSPVFTNLPKIQPVLDNDPSCTTINTICKLSFSTKHVLEALNSLDLNNGSGPDMLPNYFIKNCASSLSLPLSVTQYFS